MCRPIARGIMMPVYRKPYPKWIDRIEFPRVFIFLTFALFSGDGSQSTVERTTRFTSQCANEGTNEFLKVQLFDSSSADTVFTWFINLATNSVLNWAQMEDLFYAQFFQAEP